MFFIEPPSTVDWAMERFGVARKAAYAFAPLAERPVYRDAAVRDVRMRERRSAFTEARASTMIRDRQPRPQLSSRGMEGDRLPERPAPAGGPQK